MEKKQGFSHICGVGEELATGNVLTNRLVSGKKVVIDFGNLPGTQIEY